MKARAAVAILGLIGAAVAGLTTGCADLESMPTAPETAEDSAWSLLYAPLAYRDNLTSVWAMDADDAWFGSAGFLLHHDGRRLTRHDLEIPFWIEDIDGCASDDVWAVGDRFVARWDGRRWSQTEFEIRGDFESVHCDAPDRVYLGGSISADGRYHTPRPAIRRWTGRGWKDWIRPGETTGRVREVWRPHPQGPLVAVVEDTLLHAYSVEGGAWTLLDWPGPPLSTDRDLVLIGGDHWLDPRQLYRIEPDLSLTSVCDPFNAPAIFKSRAVMSVLDHEIQYAVDCSRRPVLEGAPETILEVAVPARPGPTSNVMFAVGRQGMALRGTWQPDWTVRWQTLSPRESYALWRPVIADGTSLFVPADTQNARGLFVVSGGAWHHEDLGWTPDGLRLLPSGDLLVWNAGWGEDQGAVGIRAADGTWRELPATGYETMGVWASTEQDLVAMARSGHVLRLVAGDWVVQNELGGQCLWFDGTAPDRLFALIVLPHLQRQVMLEFDGTAWRIMTPAGTERVNSVYLGPHSGRLWADLRIDGDYRLMIYQDGQWQDLPDDEVYLYPSELFEARDGTLYRRNGRVIQRHYPGTWKPSYRFPEYVDDFFVDPESGVHVIADDRIYHHPYRPR